MNNLLTAIYGKLSGSTLDTYVGGRVYLDEAPPSPEFPYVVYFVVSDAPDYNFKTTLEDVWIQFSLFSSSASAVEISTMYNYLKTLYDDVKLTITGSTHIWMVRRNLVTMVDEVTTPSGTSTVKHWAVDYNVITEGT